MIKNQSSLNKIWNKKYKMYKNIMMIYKKGQNYLIKSLNKK